jgi:hypothetical protein
MTPRRHQGAIAGTGMLLLLAGPVGAQTGATPPAGAPPDLAARPMSATDRCAQPRDLLAAEETTPGYLQRLAREALAACEAQPVATPVARPVARPTATGR